MDDNAPPYCTTASARAPFEGGGCVQPPPPPPQAPSGAEFSEGPKALMKFFDWPKAQKKIWPNL